ncbi:hypothetical protein PLICRDRAFT_93674 [Plicaturopsis crispa FD-325 SS-3]|nr:hypothetical protein PLICRDRAFT_93674 [Plicaturopsis crispa FD-325 SS-3]
MRFRYSCSPAAYTHFPAASCTTVPVSPTAAPVFVRLLVVARAVDLRAARFSDAHVCAVHMDVCCCVRLGCVRLLAPRVSSAPHASPCSSCGPRVPSAPASCVSLDVYAASGLLFACFSTGYLPAARVLHYPLTLSWRDDVILRLPRAAYAFLPFSHATYMVLMLCGFHMLAQYLTFTVRQEYTRRPCKYDPSVVPAMAMPSQVPVVPRRPRRPSRWLRECCECARRSRRSPAFLADSCCLCACPLYSQMPPLSSAILTPSMQVRLPSMQTPPPPPSS